MKLFKPSDFNMGETEEGFNYHTCTMCNGFEIQVESLSWGWVIGIYNMYGHLIIQNKQPYLITMAGGVNYEGSHEAMLEAVSKLYDKALSYKQIPVKSA